MSNYGVSVHIGNRISLYNLLVLLALGAAFVVLEVYLARRKSRWPGLVPPAVVLLGAMVEAVSYFTADLGDSATAVGVGLLVLSRELLPALTLLFIYAACREYRRKKQRREQDRMNICDL